MGEGKGHTPVLGGEAKENQDGGIVQERISPWARQSRPPGGCHQGVQEPRPGSHKPFPCFLQRAGLDGQAALLVWQVCSGRRWWPQPMDWDSSLASGVPEPKHRDRPKPSTLPPPCNR